MGVETQDNWCVPSTLVFKSGFHLGSYENLFLASHLHWLPLPTGKTIFNSTALQGRPHSYLPPQAPLFLQPSLRPTALIHSWLPNLSSMISQVSSRKETVKSGKPSWGAKLPAFTVAHTVSSGMLQSFVSFKLIIWSILVKIQSRG